VDGHVESGTVEGYVAAICEGDKGFGYDPLFVPRGEEKTFGQLTPAEKHKISHRGRAFKQMRAYLEQRHGAH
jgi:XTP/dITP diphosphohydrolase